MTSDACWKDIIAFGGAIVALCLGAGFASGQEILQFFAHFGLWGSLGAGFIAWGLFAWFSAVILEDGRRLQLEDASQIYAHYCGRYIGAFYEWFVPILLFLVFAVMISGAGATVSEQYGANPNMGRIGLATVALLTVLLGLRRLVHIVGYIGPVIIGFAMAMGLASIASHPHGIGTADQVLATIDAPRAAANWALSGLLYAALCLVGLMPFLAGVGRQARSTTDARLGGIFGGTTFAFGTMVLSMGLLSTIGTVYNTQIPSLVIAAQVAPALSSVFAIMMLAAIYTTAVPLLWITCNRIVTDEASRAYKGIALLLTVIACFGGQLQFSKMVGIVYPAIGYMGIVLIGGMIYTKYVRRKPAASIE